MDTRWFVNKSQPPPRKSISDISRRAEGFHSRMELFVMKVRGHRFAVILPHTVVQLPDMEFPINAKAESRVLVPWEHQVYPNLTVQATLGGPFKPNCGTNSEKPGNGHVTPKALLTVSSPQRRMCSQASTPTTSKPTAPHQPMTYPLPSKKLLPISTSAIPCTSFTCKDTFFRIGGA